MSFLDFSTKSTKMGKNRLMALTKTSCLKLQKSYLLFIYSFYFMKINFKKILNTPPLNYFYNSFFYILPMPGAEKSERISIVNLGKTPLMQLM